MKVIVYQIYYFHNQSLHILPKYIEINKIKIEKNQKTSM